MQTDVALSTKEAKHIALSQNTRDLIPIKNIVECLNNIMRIDNKKINTYSTLFEDDARTLMLAMEPTFRPRIKHACVKHRYFRHYVKKKVISIRATHSNDQQADVMTKPLALEKFKKFRQLIIGW